MPKIALIECVKISKIALIENIGSHVDINQSGTFQNAKNLKIYNGKINHF